MTRLKPSLLSNPPLSTFFSSQILYSHFKINIPQALLNVLIVVFGRHCGSFPLKHLLSKMFVIGGLILVLGGFEIGPARAFDLGSTFKAVSIHASVRSKIFDILTSMKQSNNVEVKNNAKVLSSFRFPVYKALNVASITGDTLLIDYIADVIVSQELVGLINELVKKERRMVTLGTIGDATKKITGENGAIAEMEKRIVAINEKAAQAYQASLAKMEGRVSQISVLDDTVKRLKGELARKGMYRLGK